MAHEHGIHTAVVANRALVRRQMEEGFNAGNLAIFDETYAPDFLDHHGFADQQPGLAEVKRVYERFRAAFPDLSTTIEDLVAEGDKVVVRSRLRATHLGTFQGIPPTGKPIEIEAINIYRIANGKIVERWGLNTDLMGQLRKEE